MDDMDHYLKLEAGSREIPWQEMPGSVLRIVEPTTLGRATCTCGLDSGSLPREEASAIAQEHLLVIRQDG